MTQSAEQNISASILDAVEFGSQLRQQREKKGLSIGEVSERLKLPARQIEALEKGNYDSLPEPVFIRGFLRSYGCFLDIDEALLNNYLNHFSPPVKVENVARSDGLNYSNAEIKKPFPTWILGVVVVVAIGYGIFAWQSKSQSENAKQENISAIAASNANTVLAPTLNTKNVLVKPMTASDSGVAVVSASGANNQVGASVPALPGELVINTRYRTMLTVTNAQGEVLINQIVPGRSEHRFSNGAPFEVRLGYAIGSTVTFGGVAIDVDAARKGGKTAVFTTGTQTSSAGAQ